MQEERGLADEEARQRDALYERAERLAASLGVIADSLRDAVADVNAGKPHSSPLVCHTFPSCPHVKHPWTIWRYLKVGGVI